MDKTPGKPVECSERNYMTPPQLQAAKAQYMQYTPVAKIARDMGLRREKIAYYVRKVWKEERSIVKNELLSEIANNKAAQITEISGLTLQVIQEALTDLKNRPDPPTVLEAKNVAGIFSELDKIMRLDAGTATDIISEVKPATVIELKEKLRLDPFIEFEEIKEEEEEEEEEEKN